MPCEEDRMLKSRILFSDLHSEHLVELLEFKATEDENVRITSFPAPDPHDWDPPGVFLSQAHSTWPFSSSSCPGFSESAACGFLCSSLWVSISVYLPLSFGEQQFALWCYFSGGSNKNCWFFSLLSFLLIVRTEWWLLSFFHAEQETASPYLSILKSM